MDKNKNWTLDMEKRLQPVVPYIGYTMSAGLATFSMMDLYFAINGNYKFLSSVAAVLSFAAACQQACQARALQKQR